MEWPEAHNSQSNETDPHRLLKRVVWGPVVTAELRTDPANPACFPEERLLVARAAPKRIAEFLTVRMCARIALTVLGIPPVPILPSRDGSPQWPDGIVGSLTHCTGFRGAAVARADEVHSLGIDAEPDEPLPSGVLEAIASPREIQACHNLNHLGFQNVDKVLFSTKESLLKALHPLLGRPLLPSESTVHLHPSGRFHAQLHLAPPPRSSFQTITGRWSVRDGMVLTAVVLLRRGPD